MLTVSEPDGANATGHRAADGTQGVVGFTVTISPWDHSPNVVSVVAPIGIPGGNTPVQTAGLLAAAINNLANLTARVSQNAPENGRAQGSVDVVITCATGHAAITPANLHTDVNQDSAQKVAVSVFNRLQVDDAQPAEQIRKGGPPMRRQLFKCVQTTTTRISVFVANEQRGGLTTSSLFLLAPAGRNVDAEVRNCLSMQPDRMDGDLEPETTNFLTLAHEIGHALTDADHVPDTVDISLMHAGTNYRHEYYDDKRITGPGWANHAYDIITDAGLPTDGIAVPANYIRLVRVQTTMHALIAANTSLTFTPR
jgi:hypothetical protein